MSTPRAIARVVSSLAVCTIALTACASETRDPVTPATAPQFELVTITSMVAVPVEEFSLADENGNNLACVKQTPSEQLLYKDDEAGTPSQPCPPSYQVVGKGQAIKVDKTWFTEDANRNGVSSSPVGRRSLRMTIRRRQASRVLRHSTSLET
jgi:hypothetical protein